MKFRDEDTEEAILRKRRKRIKGKEAFDKAHQVRQSSIEVGDFVLQHNVMSEINMFTIRKLSYKWLGPYRFWAANATKGTYKLEELD